MKPQPTARFEVWLKGRETPVEAVAFQAVAEESARVLCAQTGRDAYVTRGNVVVYRVRATLSEERLLILGGPAGEISTENRNLSQAW